MKKLLFFILIFASCKSQPKEWQQTTITKVQPYTFISDKSEGAITYVKLNYPHPSKLFMEIEVPENWQCVNVECEGMRLQPLMYMNKKNTWSFTDLDDQHFTIKIFIHRINDRSNLPNLLNSTVTTHFKTFKQFYKDNKIW